MAKKIENHDTAIRACEGSFELIMQNKPRGKFYMETSDGIVALNNSTGRMKFKTFSTMEECIKFFK